MTVHVPVKPVAELIALVVKVIVVVSSSVPLNHVTGVLNVEQMVI